MIKKYKIEVIIRLPGSHCMEKLTVLCPFKDINKRASFWCDVFENLKYSERITTKEEQVHYNGQWKMDIFHQADESVKDIFVERLMSKYYDKEFSLYGPQTLNCNVAGPLMSTSVLAGRNKSWFFRNKYNEIIIVEQMFDENGNRLYDASQFLEALSKNQYLNTKYQGGKNHE